MSGPYAEWRKNSYDEQDALDKIARESLLKKILGGAAILAGTMMNPRSQGAAIAQDALIMGGMLAHAARDSSRAGRRPCTRPLSRSWPRPSTPTSPPLLVEVEGQQLRLTGSAENAVRGLARDAAARCSPSRPGCPPTRTRSWSRRRPASH